ncbi:MarR family winged helix-turn-helix transcriptional regulator [Streptacidiphilus sp. P02-A3a]|uniref:MarR family winged helix-turn-helix transcriptional regulator n=1 Tax=Streptacidiphilus sp. P02-A3a TaxID=2704468 RepID=UPI0015F7CE5C|nr:MarR family transcriptional regulator [Streptacidiphilus sp. P02-A3a]QMU70959.1 MarR family transcriptional regulator [Streptacidiphilus sp. P02-A3a]
MDSEERYGDSGEPAARAANDLRVLIGRLRRRLKELDPPDWLTPTQLSVLSRLDSEGPASPGALASAERVRPQSMGATLAHLEERGLIERRTDADDGRRQVVSLTRQGDEGIRDSRRHRQEWLAQALRSHFSETELATVTEALALLDRLTRP